ncbi:unnamed protein product [Discula destructiva]
MHPFPEHFIVRPKSSSHEEAIIPLVAVDQLPDWMQVVGVPRELDVEQAVGLINLGLVVGDGEGTYEVRLHTEKIRAIISVSHENGKEELSPSDSASSVEKDIEEERLHGTFATAQTQGGNIEAGEMYPTVREDKMSQGDKIEKKPKPAPGLGLSASRHNTANDETEDEPVRKDKNIRPHLTEEIQDARARRPTISRIKDKFFGMNLDTTYCRHWCHHGTCKWGWECRYQHRMPSDQEGLHEVGLKDFPTWYLLMMAGGSFPGSPGMRGGMGVNHSTCLDSGMNIGLNMSDLSLAMPNDNSLLTGLARSPHPADAFLNANRRLHIPQHNFSPMELRLMQGRMSALLAGSTAMSNRQKFRQNKEMRELFLRSHALSRSNNPHALPLAEHSHASLIGMGNYGFHQGRANLHTNASLAANAAGLSAASRRQALREAERGAIATFGTPAREDGAAKTNGSFDELDGRLTPLTSDGEGGHVENETAVREGKLVDIG